MDRDRIEYLWICYINQTCSKAEKREFFQLMNEESTAEVVRGLLGRSFEEERDEVALKPALRGQILFGIIEQPEEVLVEPSKRVRFYWGAIAASILLVASFSLYWFSLSSQQEHMEQSETSERQIYSKGNVATLSLDDGTLINLDDHHGGIKVQTSGIAYENGESIADVGESGATIKWQTITVPQGGYYQIELEDGTKVWLNASSSLRFPSSFKGTTERIVELNGEAYFDVSKRNQHNIAKPFIVRSEGHDVEVLGTQFNVEAYKGQSSYRTTLVEGKVKIKKNGVQRILTPGQQATVGDAIQVRSVDVQEYVAWKAGDFYLQGKHLGSLIPILERWYGVQIECTEEATIERVTLQVSRNKPLNAMLKILQESIGVNYRIQGNKVYITK
ncbi:FecR family protein [Sphingobacterium yanglingense]|uniref:FecR family protein n=1 Tax=Sphingobacterium yanglingense TaxID=1437280 RepID=A0A4R6WEF5_9SPHI|nr:FecR family protein [Sphingobacterium yanglingense]TDQ76367.1 FecR family protein [Sphingobacterium yanglingense]